ncbi:ABC transporter permease [Streptomyces sp. SDT5-1]|uniref:ABC transporter permease n=1 Tax=Streptomyces sp. SDT5-1 TaxID=3406418 RepID=UPI003FCFA046
MFALAISTLRARKGGFAGAFVALLCAAALVTACAALLETGLRGKIPTERYAGTSVLVTADQNVHFTKVKKGKTKTKSKPLTERAWIEADLADRLKDVEGVRAVVPELTFPAHVLKHGADGGGASWGHAWDSARLTPFTLRAGHEPRTGEVVVDATAGARVGDQVTVQSTGAPTTYRVAGIAAPRGRAALERQSTVFFAADEARRLAGHPGKVATIGLLTAPGTDTAAVRDRVTKALAGTTAQVRTGDDLGPAEFLDAGKARVSLISLGAAMGGTSLLVALLVVTGTFALSVQQRSRELALLRAVGATPRQLRRMVGREALLVGLLAGVPGAFAGLALARWMYGRFVAVGALPDTLHLTLSAFPPIVAVLTTLLAAFGAARAAARRPARVRPTEALAESAVPGRRFSVVRLVAGVLAAAGYVILVLVLSGLRTEAAATPVTFLTVILAAAAIALLGPQLTWCVAAVVGGAVRRVSPAAGFLADRNSRANAQRLAAAVTPLSLAVAMTSTILFTQTTASHAAREQVLAGTSASYVLSAAGPGVPSAAADAVREVPGVTAATEVIRTQLRAGQDKFAAQGVTPEGLTATMDPAAVSGSVSRLTAPGTVAVSELAASTKGVDVGDRLPLTLGDGTRTAPRVVAVYARGLGFGDVLLPYDTVAAHVDVPLASSVLVAGEKVSGSQLHATVGDFKAVRVLDRAQADAAQRAQEGTQAQVNLVAMGLIIAFTGIAVVNTLVMATSARRRELAMLRLIGTTGRQVRAMLRWETLTVVLPAVALGTGIAYVTLSAYSSGMTGTSTPYGPPPTYLAIVAAAATLAFAATALPARLALRAEAAGAMGGRE